MPKPRIKVTRILPEDHFLTKKLRELAPELPFLQIQECEPWSPGPWMDDILPNMWGYNFWPEHYSFLGIINEQGQLTELTPEHVKELKEQIRRARISYKKLGVDRSFQAPKDDAPSLSTPSPTNLEPTL